MDLLDGLGKIGKAVAKGACSYLESASKDCSKNDVYSDEQRESFAEYAERMGELKDKLNNY